MSQSPEKSRSFLEFKMNAVVKRKYICENDHGQKHE